MSGRWRRALWIGLVVVAVAAGAGLLGSGLGRDPTAIRSPLVGHPAPALAAPSLDDGHPIRLADLRGQVVLVNFWASWCAECRTEQPVLNRIWDRYRDAGVVVLGVDFQDGSAEAQAFRAGHGVTYPTVVDTGSQQALSFGVYGVPETFYIDQTGRVVARHAGAEPYEQVTARIDRLLAGGKR